MNFEKWFSVLAQRSACRGTMLHYLNASRIIVRQKRSNI